MNLPLWNPIIQFYMGIPLIISFNIFNDTCMDPHIDLIVKSNYKFGKSAIEVPIERTEIARSPFKHRAASQ